ncbi:MAG TPA: Cof-type HAD-IIB family hydrolase [Candidatus Eremiobacteraceae bacterium]|nr:Cof-type HAD-IIB family hydrolase [Candidatus Eremiobacteraceae bacterium]
MNARLIAIDLDGTLVGDDLTISTRDRAAIRRAISGGIKVCLVTGRLFSASRRFADDIGLRGPLACLQGAAIYDLQTGGLTRSWPLAAKTAIRAYDFMKDGGYQTQLYFGDTLFVDSVDERTEEYLRRSRIEPTIVPDLRSLLVEPGRASGTLLKVLGIGAAADVERDVVRLSDVLGAHEANVMKSQPTYLEVTDSRADKGSALRSIAESLGISLAETAAIGDSDNDAPMLRIAGASFAVAGATAAARQAAARMVGAQGIGVADAIDALCDADACGIP